MDNSSNEQLLCDICNRSISNDEMKRVSSSTIKGVTYAGFIPKAAIALGRAGAAFGMQPQSMWMNTVNSQSDVWGLCSDCYKEIVRAIAVRVIMLTILIGLIVGGILYF